MRFHAVLLAALLLLPACKKDDSNPTGSNSSTIVGKWQWVVTSTENYTLDFSSTNVLTYTISLKGGSEVNTQAEQYSVDGNVLNLESDWTGDGIPDKGKYSYSITNNTLTFSVIADSVVDRTEILSGVFTKK